MSEPDPGRQEYSAAYMLGRTVGLGVVIFVFAAGGFLVGAGFAPDRFQGPLMVGFIASGLLAALSAAVSGRRAIFGFLALYIALVGVGGYLQNREPQPRSALIAIAVGTVLSSIGFMVTTVRAGRKSKELERMVFAETTSIAFFTTMVAAITYALIESWLDAPKLSMWVVWTVGMGTWGVGSIIAGRRYS